MAVDFKANFDLWNTNKTGDSADILDAEEVKYAKKMVDLYGHYQKV